MYCCKCGKEITQPSTYCPACGAPQSPDVSELKSKIVAGLLGILIGSLGIHRFYLGYVGIGVVQIIVSILTLGIGGLWGFIEGILILTGGINKDAQGRPLKE